MAVHYRTNGLILKKIDKGENSRVFSFYTENFGKVDVLARAQRKIKSKLRGGLREFSISEIEFIQGKNHKTLTDAILIKDFKNIRNDLRISKAAHRIFEISDILLNGEEKDERTWNLLTETFEKLDNNLSFKIVIYYFFWNFLATLGYEPQLYNCSRCQKKLIPNKLYFSFKNGGVVCGQCVVKNEDKEIDLNIVKLLRLILKKDWETLNKLKIDESTKKVLGTISSGYFSWVSGGVK